MERSPPVDDRFERFAQACCAALVALAAVGADWTEFRGPRGTSIADQEQSADRMGRRIGAKHRLEGQLARARAFGAHRRRPIACSSPRPAVSRRTACTSFAWPPIRASSFGSASSGRPAARSAIRAAPWRPHAGQRRKVRVRLVCVERSGLPRPRRQSDLVSRAGLRLSRCGKRRRHVEFAGRLRRVRDRADRMPGRFVRGGSRSRHRRNTLAHRTSARARGMVLADDRAGPGRSQ